MNALLQEMRVNAGLFEKFQNAPFSARWMMDYFRSVDACSDGLNIAELGLVLYAKGTKFRVFEGWSDDLVRNATRGAFSADSPESAMTFLLSIDGIGVSVASAILAWCKPKFYPVIDRHSWRTLVHFDCSHAVGKFDGHPSPTFRVAEYIQYVDLLREIEKEIKKTPQQIDVWLYSYSKVQLGPLVPKAAA